MYASFWLFSNVIRTGVNVGQVFVNKKNESSLHLVFHGAGCFWRYGFILPTITTIPSSQNTEFHYFTCCILHTFTLSFAMPTRIVIYVGSGIGSNFSVIRFQVISLDFLIVDCPHFTYPPQYIIPILTTR